MKKRVKFTFEISEGLFERLNEICSKLGLTKAEVVRRGLIEQLEKLREFDTS